MQSQNIHSRTHYPHLYAPREPDRKSSRSKIQLTHVQHGSRGEDRSVYTVNSVISHTMKSQYHPQSTCKERSFHSQESVTHPTMNKQLYLLMKEQIGIAAFNFQEKMNLTLKKQAEEIQKLSSVIVYNAKLIQKQQEIIRNMHSKEQNLTNTIRSRVSGREEGRTPSKSPGKISLTQRKSVQKLLSRRESSPLKGQNQHSEVFSSRIDTLIGIVDDFQKRLCDYAVKNRQLVNRVKQLERKVTGQMWRKLKICQGYIQSYLDINEQKIKRINQNIEGKILEAKEVPNKLENLTEEMQDLKSLMFNLAHRQFNYDSYQLNTLKEDFSRISQKVHALAGEHFFQEKITKEEKVGKRHKEGPPPHALTHSYSMTNERANDLQNYFEHTYTELEKSQLSSLSQYKPKHISVMEDRVKQSHDWDFEGNSPHMSDEDEFYFQQSDAEKEERQRKLNKLYEILKRSGYVFPVRVQIDGTGYLKEFSTGIYILDELDNGFELSPEEVRIMTTNGIILM